MAEKIELTARAREHMHAASKHLLREGLLPAVVYGAGVKSKPISIDRHDFEQLLAQGGLSSRVVYLQVEGTKTPLNAMVREIQRDPLKSTVVHVDFLAVHMDQLIEAFVAIHAVGDSVGVKAGGVLNMNVNGLHVEALPNELPEMIEFDISLLDIGDNVHLSDISPPTGVTFKDSPDEIICSIMAPQKSEAEEEAAVAAAEPGEPEVVGAKAEAEE